MNSNNILNISQPTVSEQIENSLKDIYCISGLGADERVFQKLKFQGYRPIHIKWVEPKTGESIADYAKRLTTQIKAENPILIGLSFGGIMAVEMAKHISTEKVILISSTKNQHEVPFYFKIFRWLPIYQILPASFILWFGQFIASWFFSLKSIDERKLFRAILFDTNAKFMKWAIHQVVIWKNELIPDNTYHIHGESDRIFPYQFVHEDFNVEHGGHFMIMHQAEYVSNLIQKIVVLNSKTQIEKPNQLNKMG